MKIAGEHIVNALLDRHQIKQWLRLLCSTVEDKVQSIFDQTPTLYITIFVVRKWKEVS
jgi:hypothetical protein